MKVIITAGGTGGHIYPAIAIINKIKEQEEKSEFLFIGTTDRLEAQLIPSLNIPFIGLELKGLNRKSPLKNIKVFKQYQKAIKESKRIIKDFKPDIVIGTGGYITAPVVKAASDLGIKTIIHEQNSIPGLSNKLLGKKVDKIAVSLPGSISYFPQDKTVYIGNPRSEEIVKVKKLNKETLGLSKNKQLVLFVMGSLGSITMTTKLKELIPSFKDKNYEVVIITGKNYYEEYKQLDVPNNVFLFPFMDNLNELLKSTDLCISRAGATTIAELTAIGLPSILVPSPYVTHNHQLMNAKELEDIGACVIVEEKDFDQLIILKNIDQILKNKELYQQMKDAALSLGVKTSATKFYQEVKELVRNDKHE